MKKSLKVCVSILMVLFCLVVPTFLQATEITIKDLFKEDKQSIGKGDFVQDAVYFSLNLEVLSKLKKANLKEFSLNVPFENDKELSLHLKQVSFLSTDFQVKIQKEDTYSTLLYSPGLYYKGSIHGMKDAFAAFNIFDDEVTGVLTVNGNNYNIGRYERGGDNSFVLYKEKNLDIPNPFECSTEDLEFIRVERPSASSRSNGNSKVSVYIECDHHLFKNMSSNATRVMDFTTGLFNVVTTLYQQESITLEISEVKVWSTPDPYLTTSAKNARNDFGSKLNGNFNGDIAHLLSNYKVNGTPPNGGSANIDVLCDKTKAVSYTNITTSYLDFPTFSWTAYAVTHEIGHNLGSPHTHSCLWAAGAIDNCWCPEGGCTIGPEPASSGTMMSYCHLDPKWTTSCELSSSNPGINFAAGFGRQPGDLIRLRVSNATCLASSDGTTSSGPMNLSFDTQHESCPGSRDANISVAVENGQAPFSYQWNTGAKTASIVNLSGGTYSVTITDTFGKKANGSATINAGIAIRIDAGPDKSFDCGDSETLLDASNSSSGSQYRNVWSKVGGNISGSIIGSIHEPTLKVTEPGTYIYTITNESTGCTTSDAVIVNEGNQTSSFQITSTTITCNQPYSQLTANTISTGGLYSWYGPNGFTSNAASPRVNVAGLYQLIIKNGNCTSTGQVQVQSTNSPPQANALGGVIDCNTPSIRLTGSSNEVVTYAWAGPNGFISSQQNPATSIPGLYTLVVTNNNGCTNTSTAQVGQSNNPPNISAQGGQLSCTNSQIMLQVLSSENNVTHKWTGPNGFTSYNKNPLVSIAGDYILTATGINGCSVNKVATVSSSTETPSISIVANPLTCDKSSTYLAVASTNSISQYVWSGPNGFTSDATRPQVTQPGFYTLQAIGANGCSSTASYSVTTNYDLPDFTISASPITCNTPTSTLQVSLTSNAYNYRWTGPNGFLSYEKTPSINTPGTYSLMVSAENGCSSIKSLLVSTDLSRTTVQVSATTISCNGGNAQLFAQSSNSTDQFVWTGPNNYTSRDQNPIVSSSGNYQLLVRSANGCSVNKTVEVKSASIRVANIITRDDHCGNGDGSIQVVMEQPNETYDVRWGTGHVGLNIPYLPAGTYSAVIKNATGCATTISVTINAGQDIRLLTVNSAKVSCYNAQDGSIALSATGGEAPYHYQWSNGIDGPVNVNLAAGTHSVEIEDARGCVRTFHFEMENPAPLEIITEIGEGEADFFVSGGSPDYQYNWSNGLTSDSADDLDNGAYEVTISDANGCAVVKKFTLESFTIVENSMGEVTEVAENEGVNTSTMISPNPADTYFNLYHEFEKKELVFISVFNAQGYYLFRKTVETTILTEGIPTSSWKEGTYYVQLLTKNGFITEELKVIH